MAAIDHVDVHIDPSSRDDDEGWLETVIALGTVHLVIDPYWTASSSYTWEV